VRGANEGWLCRKTDVIPRVVEESLIVICLPRNKQRCLPAFARGYGAVGDLARYDKKAAFQQSQGDAELKERCIDCGVPLE
jgi:hypothetical protein